MVAEKLIFVCLLMTFSNGFEKPISRHDSNSDLIPFNVEYRLDSGIFAEKVGELVREETSNQSSSTLELQRQVVSLQSRVEHLETILNEAGFLNADGSAKPTPPAPGRGRCAGKSLRLSGPTVLSSLYGPPDGIVCVGNSLSPSHMNNFLVFAKSAVQSSSGSYIFLGTQSLKGGFIDFTEYVHWWLTTTSSSWPSKELGGCGNLPEQLRGNLTGASNGCSKLNPAGAVYLFTSSFQDAVVDDNGAITVMPTNSETLWY